MEISRVLELHPRSKAMLEAVTAACCCVVMCRRGTKSKLVDVDHADELTQVVENTTCMCFALLRREIRPSVLRVDTRTRRTWKLINWLCCPVTQ